MYRVVVSNEAHVRVFSLVLRYTVRRACRGIPFLVGGGIEMCPANWTDTAASVTEGAWARPVYTTPGLRFRCIRLYVPLFKHRLFSPYRRHFYQIRIGISGDSSTICLPNGAGIQIEAAARDEQIEERNVAHTFISQLFVSSNEKKVREGFARGSLVSLYDSL